MKYAACLLACLMCSWMKAGAVQAGESWIHQGLADFSQGTFDDGGGNLYVNADGVMELVYRWDLNQDGYVDLVLANNHDNDERGPTDVFRVDPTRPRGWTSRTLANDSGYMSRIADLDGDGTADLVVVNAYNGINAALPSYVYWGGPGAPTDERIELPTVGAYDVAIADINRDGLQDLVFPSAWRDPHNPGKPLPCIVYLQEAGRRFGNATDSYNLIGVGAMSIAAGDLNGDGLMDIVLANSRYEREPNTDSFIYWGAPQGFHPAPQKLPTIAADQVAIADLNQDGFPDLLLTCSDGIRLYWNRRGEIDPNHYQLVPGLKHAVADVDGDGRPDLITTDTFGVVVRSGKDVAEAAVTIPLRGTSWITAADLNGDGRPELIVSRFVVEGAYRAESVVFWNSPDGFSPDRAAFLPTRGAMGNTAGDLDGDGKPEVVVNSTADGHIQDDVPSYVYWGSRTGYQADNRLLLPTAGSSTCSIADLNRDGYHDIVFCTSSVYAGGKPHGGLRIFWGSKQGVRPEKYLDLAAPEKVVFSAKVADFNKDGYLDLLSAGMPLGPKPEQIAVTSTVFWGSREGFATSRSQAIASNGYHSAVADLNRDGWLDLIFDDRRDFLLLYWGGPEGFSTARSAQVPCPHLAEGGKINVADIDKDGWLDLIVGMLSARLAKPDTVNIFYGGPEGYGAERKQSYIGHYGTGYTAIADYNRDGNLDLMVTAYLSATSRVLPAQLFWGNGREIDFGHWRNLYAEGSAAVVQIDLNRDGWIDAFVVNHRNDIGHKVDSRLYWNSPQGFAEDHFISLPGLGPHGTVPRDFGNAYTREPSEDYVSPVHEASQGSPARLFWVADVPADASLKFQIRSAASRAELACAPWTGPKGPNTFYERSGQTIASSPDGAQFVQYKARFTYLYGCLSPQLRQVRIDFE